MNLLAELKRRNLFRAAAFYAASAWLLVQVATQVFPFFRIAEWVVRGIIVAAAVGFPFWILFAWFYQWTPQGLLRESEVTATPSPAARQQRKSVDRWIIAMLSVAVVLLLADKFVRRNVPDELAALPQKSVAVLPFENLSADEENAYFVDGIQDEILTRLAKISALKVISRTSTRRYASSPANLQEIAKQLGVANILEGSVQRVGGAVRVNVQLIKASTDAHLWAETYDRDIKDIFAVESEIAQAVADALKAQLLPAESARIANVPTRNPQAYDRFLRAEHLLNQLIWTTQKDPDDVARKAEGLYESAVAADPDLRWPTRNSPI